MKFDHEKKLSTEDMRIALRDSNGKTYYCVEADLISRMNAYVIAGDYFTTRIDDIWASHLRYDAEELARIITTCTHQTHTFIEEGEEGEEGIGYTEEVYMTSDGKRILHPWELLELAYRVDKALHSLIADAEHTAGMTLDALKTIPGGNVREKIEYLKTVPGETVEEKLSAIRRKEEEYGDLPELYKPKEENT